MRDSFIFYRSFYESVSELDDADRLGVYDAIIRFALDGIEPELTGISSALFKAFRPQILANIRKYQNGIKGGRPKNQTITKTKPNNNLNKTKTKPNENQTESKPKPNVNDNVNDNDNVNVNGFGFDKQNTNKNTSLLNYLNSETGGSYEETEQFDDLINGLFENGYTDDDIRKVIHKKSHEWNCDGKMRTYLRPSILFGDKFEEYLNAPEPMEIQDERSKLEKTEQLRADLDANRNELEQVESRMEEIKNETGSEELKDLRFRKAHLEDVIENMMRRLEVT